MSIRARVLLALTVVLTGCSGRVADGAADTNPTAPVTVNASSTTRTFETHVAEVRARSPKLADLIVRLYSHSWKNIKRYHRWSPLHSYIYKRHKEGLVIFGFPMIPLTRERLDTYVYACHEYPKIFTRLTVDQYVAQVSHESWWVNITGDKDLKEFKHSKGLGQIQLRTAKDHLGSLGIPGLQVDDLINFPLLNLYLTASIMNSYVGIHDGDWAIALQHYNAGERGWKKGAGRPYKDKVLEVYQGRSLWNWPPRPTPTPSV